MIVLGISIGTDRGVTILSDGTPLIGIHESKLSRVYRDGVFQTSLPKLSLKYCFDNTGLTIGDIDLIVVTSIDGNQNVIQNISSELGVSDTKIKFVPNQIAMAFAIHSVSESNLVMVSGKGSIIFPNSLVKSWYIHNGYDVVETDNIHWRESTSLIKFEENSYTELYKTWIDTEDEYTNMSHMYSEAAHRLVYDKLNYGFTIENLTQLSSYSDFNYEDKDSNQYLENEGYHTKLLPNINYLADFQEKARLAAHYQSEHHSVCKNLINSFSNLGKIAVGGLLFRNSKTLSKLNNIEVTNLLDTESLALGAALYGNFKLTSKISKIDNLAIGARTNVDSIFDEIDYINKIFKGDFSKKYAVRIFKNQVELTDYICKMLVRNKIVGIHRGAHNIGINQMGCRNILVSPTNRVGIDHLTMNVKESEWWLKYDNIVHKSALSEVTDCDLHTSGYPLFVNILPTWKSITPSIVTHDDKIRYNTSSDNFVNSILHRFYELSGIPFLSTTTLSNALEPESESIRDSLRVLYNSKLSGLCIENILIIKK